MSSGTSTIEIGEVEITPIVDVAPSGMPRDLVFPDVPAARWKEQETLLAPLHWQPEANTLTFVMRSWLIRSQGQTVLVDTAVGNGKDRPNVPFHSHLRTDFLDNLAAAGVRPEDVDVVVLTHLHGDHVGWNTTFDGTRWSPTFPNARHLAARADFDFWNPANGNHPRGAAYAVNVFEESIAPVHDAGLLTLWEDEYALDSALKIEPAPGHTPGAAVLTLTSGSDRAVFVGDLIHNPLQIPNPDCCTRFDEDPKQATITRRRILGWAADNNALLLPAHLAGSGAVELSRDGDHFTVKQWGAR